LHRTIGEHVELVTALDPELAPIKADPGQIEQVLVNLAVNARDAMLDGGTLTIDTKNLVVDIAYSFTHPQVAPGDYVRLRISDTGSGMTPETIERAFEPFFTTKPKGEGSGLGLATVYGIVTQAGGSGFIYSEPGVGTTFTALFPHTSEQPESRERLQPTQDVTGGETVLVVEDEEFMREVTTRILIRNGYQVLSAANGHDALGLAQERAGPIHLLLTDVVMPKMLGKEVAERFAQQRPDTRVLFMSGYAQPVLGAKGNLEPGFSLVEKPFSEATLLSKVRDVLDAHA
jgi:CheY-like chemotaxis protein